MTTPYQERARNQECDEAHKQRLAGVRACATASSHQRQLKNKRHAYLDAVFSLLTDAMLKHQKREKLDSINFKLFNSSNLRLKRKMTERLHCMDFGPVNRSNFRCATSDACAYRSLSHSPTLHSIYWYLHCTAFTGTWSMLISAKVLQCCIV